MMFDSYTADKMADEGRDADEDKLADEVWNYYHHLRDDKHFTHDEAIECIRNDLNVKHPERYI
jgi:hypothetical protein